MTQASRVYGTEHDSPATGPQPGHTYRELTGGPLDGQLIEVTGWTEKQITTGAYLITPHTAYGPGGGPPTRRPSAAPTARGCGRATCPDRPPLPRPRAVQWGPEWLSGESGPVRRFWDGSHGGVRSLKGCESPGSGCIAVGCRHRVLGNGCCRRLETFGGAGYPGVGRGAAGSAQPARAPGAGRAGTDADRDHGGPRSHRSVAAARGPSRSPGTRTPAEAAGTAPSTRVLGPPRHAGSGNTLDERPGGPRR